MKHNRLSYIMVGAALAMAPAAASAQVTPRLADDKIAVENTKVGKTADNLMVTFDLNLDSLRLRANHQFVFTPVVKDKQNSRELPQIVVNGRRSDISYRRHGNKDFAPDVTAVRRKNGTDQTVAYSAVLPYEEWMKKLQCGHRRGPLRMRRHHRPQRGGAETPPPAAAAVPAPRRRGAQGAQGGGPRVHRLPRGPHRAAPPTTATTRVSSTRLCRQSTS